MMWTPKRLPGKNLSCIITSGDVLGVTCAAILADLPDGSRVHYTVRPRYTPVARVSDWLNITVEPHGCPDELPEHWRRMRPGNKSGLSDDTGALAGNHVLHQAISLAVHLGFSRIALQVPAPDARLRRALDSLVRPLRHRRVTVTGCAPFPEE